MVSVKCLQESKSSACILRLGWGYGMRRAEETQGHPQGRELSRQGVGKPSSQEENATTADYTHILEDVYQSRDQTW